MTGHRIVGLVAGLFALVASALPAQAASWWELNFWLSGPRYDAVVPLCDDPSVLGKIAGRFAQKESVYWHSDLDILGIDRVHEIAFRPWAAQAIPRRFCAGVASVSDGKRRPVYYAISETGSWVGISWGVEWCVVGLDRNWAYSPACRMARP